VITQERAKSNPVLVLDAGNSLTGDQDPARRTLGATSVAVMNMMGYDAIGLGPSDLTLGLATLRKRMDESQFAVLSANAVESTTGELITDPYLLRQIAQPSSLLVVAT
jgi:2',3'-cyclic-nucleotide 2'-phosphodiesterase (5'-nucleotidase family)